MEAFRLKPPYDLTHRIGMQSHVTSVFWHPLINQLLVGCGDRTSGSVHVLYSPERSEKGALLCAGKKNRPKNPVDFQPELIIHTPGALPMFRDDSWRKRKRAPEGGAVRFHSSSSLFTPCTLMLALLGPFGCRQSCEPMSNLPKV